MDLSLFALLYGLCCFLVLFCWQTWTNSGNVHSLCNPDHTVCRRLRVTSNAPSPFTKMVQLATIHPINTTLSDSIEKVLIPEAAFFMESSVKTKPRVNLLPRGIASALQQSLSTRTKKAPEDTQPVLRPVIQPHDATATYPMVLTYTVTISPHFAHGSVTTFNQRGQVEYYELQENIWTQEIAHFQVVQRPLVNLRRRMTTYMFKIGMTVDTKVIFMGSYDVSESEYSFTFPGSKVPGGMVVRGHYQSTVEYYDDFGPVHPPLIKEFVILKKTDNFQVSKL